MTNPEELRALKPFDEERLRLDIAAMWGYHGAHMDLFDSMRKKLAEKLARTVKEKAQRIQELEEQLWVATGK